MKRVAAVVLVASVALLFNRHNRPNRPEALHESQWLSAGDAKVRAVNAGTGEPTLVLIHGFGDHLMTWRAVFDRLAEHHKVIAFDLPGFGVSEKPAGRYTLDAMTDRVRGFLSAVPGPLILVGHSMGGEIALNTALTESDRVVALVLIAPAGFDVGLAGMADSMTERRARLIAIWEAARSSILPLHDPEWLGEPKSRRDYDPSFDPAYRASTSAVLEQFDFEALRRRATGYGRQATGYGGPVLLIWGSADPVIPVRVADSVRTALPCTRLEVLDRAFHRPQVERPDTVAALIQDFVANPRCGGSHSP
ncbi:MAG TPA: alpha/beta fold hydrolase [Gemmatimonadales bacterium]|nr:alpha/beta fold hydrolase [Gemmatimonadales bacterium]